MKSISLFFLSFILPNHSIPQHLFLSVTHSLPVLFMSLFLNQSSSPSFSSCHYSLLLPPSVSLREAEERMGGGRGEGGGRRSRVKCASGEMRCSIRAVFLLACAIAEGRTALRSPFAWLMARRKAPAVSTSGRRRWKVKNLPPVSAASAERSRARALNGGRRIPRWARGDEVGADKVGAD